MPGPHREEHPTPALRRDRISPTEGPRYGARPLPRGSSVSIFGCLSAQTAAKDAKLAKALGIIQTHRVEVVYWGDAHSGSDFVKPDDPGLGKAMEVVSVGLLVKETKDAVVLSLGYWADGAYGDQLTIPKGMIRKRRRLGYVK